MALNYVEKNNNKITEQLFSKRHLQSLQSQIIFVIMLVHYLLVKAHFLMSFPLCIWKIYIKNESIYSK